MFPRALRIGSIAGVDIRVDPSWVVIAVLVAVNFWFLFTSRYGHGAVAAALLGVLAALLFFASVLAHELGHALEARHRDVPVGAITLFLFGGVTETRFDVDRPRDEFALAAIGPWVSVVTAAVFGLVAGAADYLAPSVGSWLRPVAQVAGVLGWLNLGLALFNLLPGAPLDGGRVLRSLLWVLLGDRARSIRWAAWAGQALGLVLLAAGLAGFAAVVATPFTSGVSGLWVAAIGWFLLRAARRERQEGDLRARIAGEPVEVFASPPAPRLPAGATADVPTVQRGTPITEVLERLAGHDVVAVVDGDELVGLLTPASLAAATDRLRTGTPPIEPVEEPAP